LILKGGDIVYTVLESPVQMRLMRLKPGEKKPVQLHPEATTNEFEATCTADGAFYAFVQSRGNLNMRLVIRDTVTGKESTFDPGGGFASVRRPSFHPNGERVCFAIPAGTGQEIASVGRDGKDRKTLSTGGINNWPAYSTDGERIAFCSSRDGEFDLYMMNADGSDAKHVIKLKGMQAQPCWSPDGKRLDFTWNRDGKYDIHAVAIDGTGRVWLTEEAERADYPAWHSDGKPVIFAAERGGKFDLFSAASN